MRTVALYEMLFGLLTIVGGIMGYVSAGSMASLIAGVAAGIALVFTGLTIQKGSRKGLFIALAITILLLARFAPGFFMESAAFMPAGLMSILSIVSLLLIVIILVQPKKRERIF